jgi:hypothetical protein
VQIGAQQLAPPPTRATFPVPPYDLNLCGSPSALPTQSSPKPRSREPETAPATAASLGLTAIKAMVDEQVAKRLKASDPVGGLDFKYTRDPYKVSELAATSLLSGLSRDA